MMASKKTTEKSQLFSKKELKKVRDDTQFIGKDLDQKMIDG